MGHMPWVMQFVGGVFDCVFLNPIKFPHQEQIIMNLIIPPLK